MIHKENYLLFYSVEGDPNANIQCLPVCFFGDLKSQDPTLNTSAPWLLDCLFFLFYYQTLVLHFYSFLQWVALPTKFCWPAKNESPLLPLSPPIKSFWFSLLGSISFHSGWFYSRSALSGVSLSSQFSTGYLSTDLISFHTEKNFSISHWPHISW